MNAREIVAQIQKRFADIALAPKREKKFPVGRESARRLGYDAKEIDALPAAVTESFAGVGNPLALGDLRQGETVLDLGCGAGLDTLLAAGRVGPEGKVIGIDFTGEMVDKAKANAGATGLKNVTFVQGEAEALGLPAESVDVIISNGLLNLCLNKPAVLAEMFRVLRHGGRLQMADILLEDDVTEDEVARKGAWSD